MRDDSWMINTQDIISSQTEQSAQLTNESHEKIIKEVRIEKEDLIPGTECTVWYQNKYQTGKITDTKIIEDQIGVQIKLKKLNNKLIVIPASTVLRRNPKDSSKDLGQYFQTQYKIFEPKYRRTLNLEDSRDTNKSKESLNESDKNMEEEWSRSLSQEKILDDEDLRNLTEAIVPEPTTRNKRIEFLEEQLKLRNTRQAEARSKRTLKFAYREHLLCDALVYIAESLCNKDCKHTTLKKGLEEARIRADELYNNILTHRKINEQQVESEQRLIRDQIQNHVIVAVVRSINQGRRKDGRAYQEMPQSMWKDLN